MIELKNSKLSEKEKKQISGLLSELTDIFGDFYITKNNLRLFIKENPDTLFKCVQSGDKLAYNQEGMAVVVGYSDNAPRKYLKVLTKDDKTVSDLIKRISWDMDCDLFVKIKKNNPLRKILEQNYFSFAGGRGKEILLVRRARKNVNEGRGNVIHYKDKD